MLRLIAILLVLCNLLYWLWSDGQLPAWGPEQQTEPQRLKEQIQPQALRLLSAQELQQLQAAALANPAPACLQSAPLSVEQSVQLRSLLSAALDANSWTIQPLQDGARWLIYMGNYGTAEELGKKESELKALKIPFQALSKPGLQYGLSLGSYATREAAMAALGALSQRGIRTARLLPQDSDTRAVLRVHNADDALRARLGKLDPGLEERLWRACTD